MIISTRQPAVAVEYTDGRTGARRTREFGTDVYAAKRFFQLKTKHNREPQIKKGAEA